MTPPYPPPQYPPPGADYPSPPPLDPEVQRQRQWAMFAHLSCLISLLTVFGGLIGTIIVYSMRRNDVPFVRENARNALNSQITLSLVTAFLGAIVLFAYVGLFASSIAHSGSGRTEEMTPAEMTDLVVIFLIVIPLMFVNFAGLVWNGIAAYRAYNGAIVRYPFAYPFVKARP